MVRLIHTADWHLGKRFSRYERGDELWAERFEAVERIGRLADTRDADAVVVAGDVFESNTIERRVVRQTLARLDAYTTPVYLLPGNHDHVGSPEAVLDDPSLRDEAPDHVHVLSEPIPERIADGEAILLPAPLDRRRDRSDPTESLDARLGGDLGGDPIRIGLAHGHVETTDGGSARANHVIPADRAERSALDYLALGDWHGVRRVNARTWYAGTPEPDQYRNREAGRALCVEIASRGAEPDVERMRTGRLTWTCESFAFRDETDLEEFERWLDSLDNIHHALIRLEIEGRLNPSERARLEARLEQLRETSYELDVRGEVVPALEAADLSEMELEGYLDVAASRLHAAAEGDDGEADARLRRLLEEAAPWQDESMEPPERARRALHVLRTLVRGRDR